MSAQPSAFSRGPFRPGEQAFDLLFPVLCLLLVAGELYLGSNLMKGSWLYAVSLLAALHHLYTLPIVVESSPFRSWLGERSGGRTFIFWIGLVVAALCLFACCMVALRVAGPSDETQRRMFAALVLFDLTISIFHMLSQSKGISLLYSRFGERAGQLLDGERAELAKLDAAERSAFAWLVALVMVGAPVVMYGDLHLSPALDAGVLRAVAYVLVGLALLCAARILQIGHRAGNITGSAKRTFLLRTFLWAFYPISISSMAALRVVHGTEYGFVAAKLRRHGQATERKLLALTMLVLVVAYVVLNSLRRDGIVDHLLGLPIPRDAEWRRTARQISFAAYSTINTVHILFDSMLFRARWKVSRESTVQHLLAPETDTNRAAHVPRRGVYFVVGAALLSCSLGAVAIVHLHPRPPKAIHLDFYDEPGKENILGPMLESPQLYANLVPEYRLDFHRQPTVAEHLAAVSRDIAMSGPDDLLFAPMGSDAADAFRPTLGPEQYLMMQVTASHELHQHTRAVSVFYAAESYVRGLVDMLRAQHKQPGKVYILRNSDISYLKKTEDALIADLDHSQPHIERVPTIALPRPRLVQKIQELADEHVFAPGDWLVFLDWGPKHYYQLKRDEALSGVEKIFLYGRLAPEKAPGLYRDSTQILLWNPELAAPTSGEWSGCEFVRRFEAEFHHAPDFHSAFLFAAMETGVGMKKRTLAYSDLKDATLPTILGDLHFGADGQEKDLRPLYYHYDSDLRVTSYSLATNYQPCVPGAVLPKPISAD